MTTTDSPVILLTGASRGLGLAIAQILLEKHNCRLATLSRSKPTALQDLEDRYGDKICVLQGDIGKSQDDVALVQTAIDKWGRIDGVILNGGAVEPLCKLADLPQSIMPEYVQTNLLSILYLIQPALPYLRISKGKIVMVSSGAAVKGNQTWGLYSMVKAGMNSLCRTLGSEEKVNGVGVWSVRPGMVDTAMQGILRNEGPKVMDPADVKKFQDAYENGELLHPDIPGAAIAQLVLSGPMDLSGEFLDWNDPRISSVNAV
ncbi:hypothetical protein TREMEDRAFT_57259 [Tremella mesenterica DSM 1558]|uniref:uncharacterized protein n=1 Tax=Tremella mesenterica (strain ATCC 24925 / CBS 8224 / DSM 1558 / NBRC 9311 / NRRL Y-6157 / RJB 2259-6 / UBC 559-6) TaxID=578456 RepID=UPI0003F48F9B|nr:uncharacterized protein TREMEDRAFT_57259 [Tremella mesenterica DSM 1558]EIW68250.1 hypothetical protein TREMEDRAFT_57259 [Tremella mesenterica DSM 1558]